MERAILVGLDLGKTSDFENSMAELDSLAKALSIEVVGICTQKADAPTSNYYIGKGKVDILKQDIMTLDANLLIFDDELSPSHIRNLEKALEIKIVDRTILILDIFAKRARTKEAMLQVELAQATYLLPRIVGMYRSLSRQKSGTGSKGPGEQQLELDRRVLRDKITKTKRELKDVVITRRTQRNKRRQASIKTVAIAGYTNSGKSTLMNAILMHAKKKPEKYVFEKDMLFATLETQTREVSLEHNRNFVITDTVGFISKLPHNLIEAFKSTLEEVKEADLIMHVIDVANPNYQLQVATVETVLTEIGVSNIPIINVYNKIDLVETPSLETENNAIYISALNDNNIDLLLKKIDQLLYNEIKTTNLLIPFAEGQIYSFLKDKANIRETTYTDEGIVLKVELTDDLLLKYSNYII
ncbi:MAG: GTPase HflX [Candidatus Izemoplasmatales bacterium]|nr:GTPase HflX [Candidatus Izemoplasmatales bacterium]